MPPQAHRNQVDYYENNYEMEDESSGTNHEQDEESSRREESSKMEDSQTCQTKKTHDQRQYTANDNGTYERVIRKRKRKSGDQLKTLVREFDRNPNWTKDTLLEVSKKTGLSEA